ncbi:MAG TPA: oxidoreductase [Betaproteobacteria bacterium]|jgi:2,4-dienoyl-CoA reductase-like NADH-dependent reductase (Old Yellow Enzyme family)|nr:NADH:flavin oxidoreductase/NADH oxidase [Burkholderiales bacterium]HAT52437.1 oxidoreductase [Betaproteobacteria bacterium]HAU83545.1 oxidoreductase [Betaproteobacteria bacterium]
MASQLFSQFQLGPIDLSNRIVVSPMCQYIADQGKANDWHLMHYGNLSIGAGALLIFEATHVSSQGRITHECLGLYDEETENALQRVVSFCREYGQAKLGIQLAHAGRKGSAKTPMQGGAALQANENPWETLAPSALAFADGWHVPKSMTKADLLKVKSEFVESAKRAVRLGFDVIELHAAHGYLLNQFTSPLSNHRTDEYGGNDLSKRLAYPLEVFDAVKEVVPKNIAFGARISGTDWVEGGLNPEEMIVFAKELAQRGCHFVDVTSGQLDSRQQIQFAPGFNLPFSKKIKNEVMMAAMGVGMITTPKQAEEAISSGAADLIAIARGAMDDPRWAWHAAKELGVDLGYVPNYQRCHPSVWKS